MSEEAQAPKRKVLRDGFVGGGKIECDGIDHWMVREQHEEFKCPKEAHLGPCMCPKSPSGELPRS